MLGVVIAVALALAEAARIRGEHFPELARARAAAARARQEQTRRQASEERLRIARELHDVLGHHLSLINVRAGVGAAPAGQPARSRPAPRSSAIKQASAEALREVRGVLAALRPRPTRPRRARPRPGLADAGRRWPRDGPGRRAAGRRVRASTGDAAAAAGRGRTGPRTGSCRRR